MEKTWEQQGGSAFPVREPTLHTEMGMSLRDYFAGQAIAGALSENDDYDAADWKNCAAYAYRLADAMLTERNKANKP